MKKNNEHFKSIIGILKELNSKYPHQGIARHLHDATLEYKNLWGLEDKELQFALTRYKAELDLNVVDEKEVDEILKDGMNLGADLDDIDSDIANSLIDDRDWEIGG